MSSKDTTTRLPPGGVAVGKGARRAVALLDAGMAQNKAQLAERFLDLARLLSSTELPTPRDWQLARASIALTIGILAREDQQVADMIKSREDKMADWLLDTLNPTGSALSGKRISRKRVSRKRICRKRISRKRTSRPGSEQSR